MPEKTPKPMPKPEVLEPVVEARIKRENRELKHQLQEALKTQVLDSKYRSFLKEIAAYQAHPPEWSMARSRKRREAIPVAHLSDAHFDEVIDPAQVQWLNCYNRAIAEMRLRRFFEKTITLCDDYMKGVEYPGMVLAVSGDMFSGSIHEELKETNAAGLCESLRYWIDPMEAGIQMLAERFTKVRVTWVVGNHPRMDKKPRAKGGVHENFDWLLGSILMRDFGRAGNKRVTFEVSDAFDYSFKVNRTRYLQTHGDQFRGGSGISAALAPWFIGESRKRERQQLVNDPFDVMIMGHWHWRVALPSIKGNGSLKGLDEYAFRSNFRYQEPLQSFWLDTAEHGITVEAPIFVQGRNEGWERAKTQS